MATGTEIDDQFTCAVHLDILVDPVVLPDCQHWICKGCLQKYVNSKNGIELECPECRKPFDLPTGGVDAFPVNLRVRGVCQTILARQNSRRSPEVSCGKHQGEPLSRFCCKCLEAVCEECGDEDHAGHRVRNIGSAWKVVAQAIEQIFEKSKEAARHIDESLEHSITRRGEIDKMKEAASSDVNDLKDKICNHVTVQANDLIHEIERRFDEQDAKEKQYFENVSASFQKVQNITKYEEHLRKMLSSHSHVVTEADLEALASLKTGEHLNNTTYPTPRFSSYLFEPNPSLQKMLSESIGDILTPEELKQREATKAAAINDVLSHTPSSTPTPFRPTSSRLFVIPPRPSSQLVTPTRPPSGFLATPSSQSPLLRPVSVLGDLRDPPPTDSMIRVRSRVMLPHSIVNPVDVEPYLEDRFIISDKTGSVTLISSNAGSNEGRKVISLKPSTNSQILVQSGVVVTRDKRLFTCNGTQTHVEQYDLDSIACVRRIGDETRFTSPRCLTHGVTNRMLYVSDIKGGIKVFDSYNGQHVDDIGGGLLLTPSGLTTDDNSRLFVADELQGHVYVFDIRMNRGQQPLQKLSTDINGTLLHCHDVAVSTSGNIYVTVTRNLTSKAHVSLLLEYDGRGRCKRKGGWELRQPRGLRVVGRSAIVVDETDNSIATYML